MPDAPPDAGVRGGESGVNVSPGWSQWRIRIAQHGPNLLIYLLILGMVGLLFTTPGMHEMATWESWIERGQAAGPFYAYHEDPNAYPPGMVTLLWLVSGYLQFDDRAVIVKTLLLAFTVLSSVAAGLWLRRWAAAWIMLATMGVGSVALAFLDVLFVLPLTLALWALQRNRWLLFSFLFATATLIKWQPLVIGPVIAVYLVKQVMGLPRVRDRWILVAEAVAPAALLYVMALGLFGPSYVLSSATGATAQNMLSGEALNFDWLLTALVVGTRDSFSFVDYIYVDDAWPWMVPVSQLAFVIAYALLLWRFARSPGKYDSFMVAALLSAVVYFMLAVGVHSNHLIMATPMAIAVVWLVPRLRLAAVMVLLMSVLNDVIFFGVSGTKISEFPSLALDYTVPFAALFVLCGLYVYVQGLSFLREPEDHALEVQGVPAGYR